jgi:hypothetical protein
MNHEKNLTFSSCQEAPTLLLTSTLFVVLQQNFHSGHATNKFHLGHATEVWEICLPDSKCC